MRQKFTDVGWVVFLSELYNHHRIYYVKIEQVLYRS